MYNALSYCPTTRHYYGPDTVHKLAVKNRHHFVPLLTLQVKNPCQVECTWSHVPTTCRLVVS